jgi:cyclopropane-fatty-acyl-phospholipid synthase
MDSGNKHQVTENMADSSDAEEKKSAYTLDKRNKSPLFHPNVTWFDRWLARAMMDVVGNPAGTLRLWDGQDVTPPVDDPVAVIQYTNRLAMWKTIINPELHWGDLYCNGQIEFSGDLANFLEIIYRHLYSRQKNTNWARRFITWLGHRRIANTKARAEENIHHHYDIGNDFYRLWLDTEEMQYTCAYFPDPDMSLEEAQIAKLHHICRKLQLKPGDTVVEAGCGWGGLARFMAKHYGVKVKAYNISKEQVAYARQCAEEQGLSDRVEYVLDDYRNINGEFDVFVSVGMLEHVGKLDYPVLGEVIDRCLRPEGRGLIHAIGRIRPGPMNAWIERRIFPGAYPPSLKEMMDIFEPRRLSVLDVENLRLHYAKTLEFWLYRFEKHTDEIRAMMDEEFVKAWRLYLAGSIAAFNAGELQLYQVVFARDINNNLPWSRAHLYNHGSDSTARLSIVLKDNSYA